jgi:DNA-binding transcriptional LysR family regulator
MKEIHDSIGDVRLLVVLDVLLEERNATRAAARLGVTQSSVSHSLRRLRDLFGDTLLVRSGRQLALTPRADALRAPLHDLLRQLQNLVRGDDMFDPRTSTRRFVVAGSDLFASSMLPRLMKHLATRAPRMSLGMRTVDPRVFGALEHDGVDVLFGGPLTVPRGFHRRELFRDDFTCVVRKGHPRIGRTLSLDAYVGERHVLVTPTGRPGSLVDDRLTELGRRRDVALTLPHFMAAGLVVAGTDLVSTLPTRTATPMARHLGLRRLAPPLPGLEYAMFAYWHSRVAHDPAVAWLLDAAAAGVARVR